MSEKFILTDKGNELLQNILVSGTPLKLSTLQMGNGGDTGSEIDPSITELKNMTTQQSLDNADDTIKYNDVTKQTVISVQVNKEDVVGINEIGILDESSNLIFYGVVDLNNPFLLEDDSISVVRLNLYVKIDQNYVEQIVVNDFSSVIQEYADSLDESNTVINSYNVNLEEIKERINGIEVDIDGLAEQWNTII